MHLLGLALATPPHITLPAGLTRHLQLGLRWIHFIAGITWVGLLYFFNLVNTPFLREIDASTRSSVVPVLMTRALWWFRWSAVVTVLAGMWYWMIIVHADAHIAGAGRCTILSTFIVICHMESAAD